MKRGDGNILCNTLCVFQCIFPSLFCNFLFCRTVQTIQDIVCIYYRPLSTLHTPMGQVDHAIRDVMQLLRPRITEQPKHKEQYLKVVVLLVSHNIQQLIKGPVLCAKNRRANILRNVHSGAVRAKQRLFV